MRLPSPCAAIAALAASLLTVPRTSACAALTWQVTYLFARLGHLADTEVLSLCAPAPCARDAARPFKLEPCALPGVCPGARPHRALP